MGVNTVNIEVLVQFRFRKDPLQDGIVTIEGCLMDWQVILVIFSIDKLTLAIVGIVSTRLCP